MIAKPPKNQRSIHALERKRWFLAAHRQGDRAIQPFSIFPYQDLWLQKTLSTCAAKNWLSSGILVLGPWVLKFGGLLDRWIYDGFFLLRKTSWWKNSRKWGVSQKKMYLHIFLLQHLANGNDMDDEFEPAWGKTLNQVYCVYIHI